ANNVPPAKRPPSALRPIVSILSLILGTITQLHRVSKWRQHRSITRQLVERSLDQLLTAATSRRCAPFGQSATIRRSLITSSPALTASRSLTAACSPASP